MMLLNMSQNPTGGRNFQLFVNGNRVEAGAEGGAAGGARPPAGIEG